MLSDLLNSEIMKQYADIVDNLRNHKIPHHYPENQNRGIFYHPMELGNEALFNRDAIVDAAGFAFLAEVWVDPLAKWIGNRKCLEVMAGSGSLSKCLQDRGVSCIATDIIHDDYYRSHPWNDNRWTDIEVLSAVDAIQKYGKDTDIIIMSWPPYMREDATETLLAMREVNPNAVMIYIGEGEGGCTADDSFFENIEYLEDGEFSKAATEYRSSHGIHDRLYLVK